MYEVINYEVVSKMLNLLYSQNPHSFSPLFYPNSASNPPNYPVFTPLLPSKITPLIQTPPSAWAGQFSIRHPIPNKKYHKNIAESNNLC